MKRIGSVIYALVISSLVPNALLAEAVVHSCSLQSNDGLTDAELRVYEYNETVHSAFVQLTTEAKDTLPNVFICTPDCVMVSFYDDYQYRLQFAPKLAPGSQVTLRALSIEDEHGYQDEFLLGSCSQIRRPTE